MGYKVYIRKDYKPLVRGTMPGTAPKYGRIAALASFAALAGFALIHPAFINGPAFRETTPATIPDLNTTETQASGAAPETRVTQQAEAQPDWRTVSVQHGDNLSLIFKREQLNLKTLDRIMGAGPETSQLARIRPGQEIRILVVDGRVDAIQLQTSHWETLEVHRTGEDFATRILKSEVETRTRHATGLITDSLFLSGQRAGLSDPLLMDLISIYAWDVDFALEVRAGDSFKVLYDEYFRDGERVGTGPILAAEFINQGRSYVSVRYTSSEGRTDYYSSEGLAMRKAFLRTPLNFTRISSTFSLGRRHPILNTIRAHRGVDYAAPQGTPVKAAGNGTVVYVGSKGGYGRTVILRHGSKYSTLYAHLSRYAPNLRQGQRVDQGRIIGYVGMSGLATGPHLHYEFQVAGIHRNPLTVDLPKAEPIAAAQVPRFQQHTAPLLAQLGSVSAMPGAAVAMREAKAGDSVVH